MLRLQTIGLQIVYSMALTLTHRHPSPKHVTGIKHHSQKIISDWTLIPKGTYISEIVILLETFIYSCARWEPLVWCSLNVPIHIIREIGKFIGQLIGAFQTLVATNYLKFDAFLALTLKAFHFSTRACSRKFILCIWSD